MVAGVGVQIGGQRIGAHASSVQQKGTTGSYAYAYAYPCTYMYAYAVTYTHSLLILIVACQQYASAAGNRVWWRQGVVLRFRTLA